MSPAELQIDLIKSICAIKDIVLLEKIKQFILEKDNYILSEEAVLSVNEVAEKYNNKHFSTTEEDVHIFTPEQRKRILNSLQQCEKGKTLTKEEAEADIQLWL